MDNFTSYGLVEKMETEGRPNSSMLHQSASTKPGAVPTLTEALRDCAAMASALNEQLDAAHSRLFDAGPKPVSNGPEAMPPQSTFDLVMTVRSHLQVALRRLSEHHARI